MSEKQPTIVDVAREASVSTATVSRAMTGGSISAATREKVEAAMKRLRYRPAGPAARKREREDRRIAAVLSDQTSPYYAAMCEGTRRRPPAAAGWSLLILSGGTDLNRGWMIPWRKGARLPSRRSLVESS